MSNIPWIQYSEEEVQAVLTVLFRRRGYAVYNIHKMDKVGEKGIDLECRREGEKDRIIIAVKKKPRSKDVSQLRQFANRTARTKVYVYIDEPTLQFKKEMVAFEDKVSFWGDDKLTSEIFKTDTHFYLSLIVENRFLKELYDITMSLCLFNLDLGKCKERWNEKEPVKADYEMLNLLWVAKDRSASLYRSLRALQTLFEESNLSAIDEGTKESILNGFLASLFELSRKSLKPLRKLFLEFLEKYPTNFARFCVETKDRSNWFYFFQNIPRLSPGHIIKTLEEGYAEHLKLKDLLGNVDTNNEEKEDLASILGDISRVLADGLYWIEDTVDDLYSIGLYEHWDTMRSKFPSLNFEDSP